MVDNKENIKAKETRFETWNQESRKKKKKRETSKRRNDISVR